MRVRNFSDAAGNSNLDGSDANNSVTFTVDTTSPSPSPSPEPSPSPSPDPSPDSDGDGISTATEDALATLAVSQGISGRIRDINNDDKKDSEQSAVATFAWRSVADFEKGNLAKLTEAEAAVSICALSTNNQADDQNLQLENIQTLDFQDNTSFGTNAANNASINRQTGEKTIQLASGKTRTTTWDPLCFDLKPKGTQARLADIDPQRPGTQVHIYIDTRASNLKKSEVNSYIKFVSQTSIEQAQKNGQPLSDLDGNHIEREGWYDFTQRRDADNKLSGDGANLIFNGHGLLQGIKLTLTDNRFGDHTSSDENLRPWSTHISGRRNTEHI